MPELILTTALVLLLLAAPHVIRAYRAEREIVRRREAWNNAKYRCPVCGGRMSVGNVEFEKVCSECFADLLRGAPCA